MRILEIDSLEIGAVAGSTGDLADVRPSEATSPQGYEHARFAQASSEQSYLLSSIRGRSLEEPIYIRVTLHPEGFFAESDALDLWGTGATVEDAIFDLEGFFLAEHSELTSRPDSDLDLLARRRKQTYRAIVSGARK